MILVDSLERSPQLVRLLEWYDYLIQNQHIIKPLYRTTSYNETPCSILVRAYLSFECFQETIFFASKGNFHVASHLFSDTLLLQICYFVYKQINQNNVMLGSSQDSKLKIFVLTRNIWYLGNIQIISMLQYLLFFREFILDYSSCQ